MTINATPALTPVPSTIKQVAFYLLLIIPITALPVFTAEEFTLTERTLQQVTKQYGDEARTRLLDWQRLITSSSGNDEEELVRVNRFFNQLSFIDDRIHWKKNDYWATPVEFLASNGGDCEDFSIAKYFTLQAMGIPEHKLQLTYVKALQLNQAHMVLTYYPTPDAEPLVLDNLQAKILPAGKRQDLLPVYSFNGSGLWLSKQRGRGKMVGSSDRLQRWQDLLQRMNTEFK